MAKEKTEKVENIWVTSGTGKSILLVDKTLDAKQPTRIDINQRMAAEGIGVEVPKTDFVNRKIVEEKLLKELSNKVEAKKAADEFAKQVKAEQKERLEKLTAEERIAAEAGKVVQQSVREVLSGKL
jgi:hypothetical protein